MDDIEVLHHLEDAHAHAVSNLQGNKAIGEALLSLELWRDQGAASKRLADALRILKLLDTTKH